MPENPASYRVVRTKSYLFNKAAQDLAQAMLEHISDVASRIASLEHSSLTQDEADIISEEISDALLMLFQCIEETREMALELVPNTNTREALYNY
ncbi:hypothetical protein ACCR79_04095 [Klebsiella pneumoniae]